jgi:hypothetical protein
MATRAALQLSFDLKEKKQFICFLELLALAAPLLAGRDILHFGDNSAANTSAIRGYSSAPDMARVVSALHLQWLRLRVRKWIEYVKSGANGSDDPSRGGVALLAEQPS